MHALHRRWLPLLIILLLVACDSGPRAGLAPNVRHELARGESYAHRLVAVGQAGVPDDASTIALGYLERLRLGLGSPFRLIDYALHDPRLGDEVRRPLAWALLQRTLRGEDYRLDPASLDCVGTSAAGFRRGVGRYHLQLIEGAVAGVDPRAGELAIRLAYTLAAAEGSVWAGAPRVVARAAALARDRELARVDALRLLRQAHAQQSDPLELLVRWRAERRFQVEAPRPGTVPGGVERQALALAPRLATAIRLLGPRLTDEALPSDVAAGAPGPGPLLGPAAATRLAELADSAAAPPETPLVLALRTHAGRLLEDPRLSPEEARDRQALLRDGSSEERLTARLDLALDRSGGDDPALANAMLALAAALRSYAQEPVWFSGFPGPSARELADVYGVDVSFDRDVPADWRPYFRRMLEQSLTDLQRVLPAAGFRGLRVRFGRDPLGTRVLALHDPERRIIYLPPATAAGTIAHELAHDLDWQAAVKRYGVRGDYATDMAARGRRDRLAWSVSGLAGATLAAPRPGSSPQELRPAEMFARNLEWFVAVTLAHDGILDGYLSSVQDAMLTGYGSVLRPDLTGGTGRALIDVLDQVAPIYPATRGWYLRSYGPGRVLAPLDLLRRVLAAAGRDQPPAAQPDPAESTESATYPSAAALGFAAVQHAQQVGLAAIDDWVCAAPGAIYDRTAEAQRRELVALAAAARARGIARRLAGQAAGRAGEQWLERRLYGAPWPEVELDASAVRALEPLLAGVLAVDTAGFASAREDFDLPRPGTQCGTMGLPGIAERRVLPALTRPARSLPR